MSPLQILADENIPLAREMFSSFGSVRLMHGREIQAADVRDIDALIVRSITRVNEELLSGSRVRFVGTATIGTDHIDLSFLQECGIHFASAAGSNANSVAEYVIAALLAFALQNEIPLHGKKLGIVGRGNIGSRVKQLAPALGVTVLLNDPPLQRAGIRDDWVDLQTVLAECDFITFHVPLIRRGMDQTFHLIGADELGAMRKTALLINTARGPVINNEALARLLAAKHFQPPILDVFENEPNPDWLLVENSFLATPHIAGYSFDGKINGTKMMARALSDVFFEGTPHDQTGPEIEQSTLEVSGSNLLEQVACAVLAACPIAHDDGRMREALTLPPELRAAHFDRLRKEYPVRLEFPHYRVSGVSSAATRAILSQLGFTVC